jgi:hypothetical protein
VFAAFILSSSWHDRIKNVQTQLVNNILKQDTTLPLCELPWVVLHLIPYEALDPLCTHDLKPADDAYLNLTPLWQASGFARRYNLDGILAWTNNYETQRCVSYTQIFRNGIIEAVYAGASADRMAAGDRSLSYFHIEVELIKALRRFLRIQQILEVSYPIVILVSLLGVREWYLDPSIPGRVSSQAFQAYRFGRDNLHLPGVTVESWDIDPIAALRPIFDTLWNAGGSPRCMHYSEAGELQIEPGWFNQPGVI